MEYKKEGGVPASVPEFGAIFMSSGATRKECFRQKLFCMPSSQENFVKRVKSGMLLFLFDFEKRELYGVYKACSDGAMNIVSHAFGTSGKQFPAQVRFLDIRRCNPLPEHEFREAISENYYSPKRFTFGLSDEQVRRLLYLFFPRKLENRVFRRQFGGMFSIRNRGDMFVEEDNLAHTTNLEYNGNSSNGSQIRNNKRYAESSFGYETSTEHERTALGRTKSVIEDSMNLIGDKLFSDYDVCTRYSCPISNCELRGPLCSARTSKENQFLFRDNVETRDAITRVSPGDFSARAVRGLTDDRVQTRDLGDKHTPSYDGFQLGTRAESFENLQSEQRSSIDDQGFTKDIGLMTSDVYSEHPLLKRRRSDNAHTVGNSSGMPLSYADLYEQMRQPPSFNSSKPMMEAHYDRNQHKPPSLFSHPVEHCMNKTSYPTSLAMEKNKYGSSYPTYHDLVLTRSVPNDREFPKVNVTSHVVQDFVPHHVRVRNFSPAFIKSSPYFLEAEDSSPKSDGAFRRISEVPMHDNQDLYVHHDSRIDDILISGGYRGKTEKPLLTEEIYEDRLPFLRSPIYDMPNISPSIEFNEHTLPSQDRVHFKFQENVSDQQEVIYGMGYAHVGSSFERFSGYDISSYQDPDGLPTNFQNRRPSVFSRLSKPARKRGQEHEGYMEDDILNESVNQVMETLYRSQKITGANRHSLGTKRQEKRFIQIQVDEPTMMAQKMVINCRLASQDGNNDEDVAKETRVVKFKSRSETKKSQNGAKVKGIVEPALVGSVQKPEGNMKEEGELEQLKSTKLVTDTRVVEFKRRSETNKSHNRVEGNGVGEPALGQERECSVQKPVNNMEEKGKIKQLKRRKLVRPVFGKKEEVNDRPKGDAHTDSRLHHEKSSCNKVASCDFTNTSLGNPNGPFPNSQVHKRLVRPCFGKKEEPYENSEKGQVFDLQLSTPNNQRAAACEFSGKILGNLNCPSPKSGSRVLSPPTGTGKSEVILKKPKLRRISL